MNKKGFHFLLRRVEVQVWESELNTPTGRRDKNSRHLMILPPTYQSQNLPSTGKRVIKIQKKTEPKLIKDQQTTPKGFNKSKQFSFICKTTLIFIKSRGLHSGWFYLLFSLSFKKLLKKNVVTLAFYSSGLSLSYLSLFLLTCL